MDSSETIVFLDTTYYGDSSILTVDEIVGRALPDYDPKNVENTYYWANLTTPLYVMWCPDDITRCTLDRPDLDQREFYDELTFLTWGKDPYKDFTIAQFLQTYGDSFSLCAAIDNDTSLDKKSTEFWLDYCTSKLKPLCMRGNDIKITNTRKMRKLNQKKENRFRKKKNRFRKKKQNKMEKNNKVQGSSVGKGRQLTGTGQSIEMCATLLPALAGVCFFWPSYCYNNEPDAITESPPERGEYEDYDYDDYYDFNDVNDVQDLNLLEQRLLAMVRDIQFTQRKVL